MIFQEVHNAGSLDGDTHSLMVVRYYCYCYCTALKQINICYWSHSHIMTESTKSIYWAALTHVISISVHSPDTLKEAPVPIISTKKCNSSCMYNGEITSRMLCAGYTEGKVDACQVRQLFWTALCIGAFKDWAFHLWAVFAEMMPRWKLGQCVTIIICIYLTRVTVGVL